MAQTLELVKEFHRHLPERIRSYLRDTRGIPDAVIDRHLLGWNGFGITVPITDREGNVRFCKAARDPAGPSDRPKMLAPTGSHVELYDWQTVLAKPEAIVICEGEYDKLVLESRGFSAVTSTGGALTFRSAWAEAFREIPHVFVCFDNDVAGRTGAKRVAQIIPHARIVQLPEEVGEGGDVTDFFVRLGRSPEEFLRLLETAQPLPAEKTTARKTSGVHRNDEINWLKHSIAIEDVISRYVQLFPSGGKYISHCPFHADHSPSFVVYPKTQTFYCFGCLTHGDVFTFLMLQEHLTFPEALAVLRKGTGEDGHPSERNN